MLRGETGVLLVGEWERGGRELPEGSGREVVEFAVGSGSVVVLESP